MSIKYISSHILFRRENSCENENKYTFVPDVGVGTIRSSKLPGAKCPETEGGSTYFCNTAADPSAISWE